MTNAIYLLKDTKETKHILATIKVASTSSRSSFPFNQGGAIDGLRQHEAWRDVDRPRFSVGPKTSVGRILLARAGELPLDTLSDDPKTRPNKRRREDLTRSNASQKKSSGDLSYC